MPHKNVGDVSIYYEIKGDGFPLVMIRGFGSSLYQWSPEMIDQLSKRYRLLLFDNRGAGRTNVPKGEYSLKMMAGDTVGLMSALNIHRAHVMGISMGGMIVQEIALHFPERLGKPILACTTPGRTHAVPAAPEVMDILINPGATSEEIARNTLSILHPKEYREKNPEMIEQVTRRFLAYPITPEGRSRQMGALVNFDSFDRLGQINASTLVLTGSRDVLVPPENSNILAERIRGAKLAVLEGMGHGFADVIGKDETQIILDFLD
jgi:3-oxoadipate enol-lactonase